MAERLSDLVLRITADSRQLQRELSRVESRNSQATRRLSQQWRQVSSSFSAIAGKVGGVAGLIATAAGGIALSRIDQQAQHFQEVADSIDKTASKLGVSRQALQEWRFAAELAGVGADTFDMALQRFVRRVGEAASGTGEARGALRELGVAVRDAEGNLRSSESVFQDAIRSLGRIEDETIRAATAQKLFDSEGVGLVNLARNFDALVEDARGFGIALEDDVIDALVKTKDAAAALDAQLEQRLSRSLSKFAILSLLIKKGFVDAISSGSALVDESEKLSNAFVRILPPEFIMDLETMDRRLVLLREDMNAVNAELLEFGTQTQFSDDRIRLLSNRLRDLIALEGQLEKRRAKLLAPAPAPTATPLSVTSLRPEDPASVDRSRQFAAAQRELNAILDAGLTPAERLARAMESLTRHYEDGLISGEQLTAAQAAIGKQFEELVETSSESARGFAQDVQSIGDSFLSGFSDSLASLALEGKATFEDLARSFSRDFVSAAIRSLTVSGFLSIFGGPGIFGGGSLFGGGRALGGPVSPGRAYLVGEQGPELLVPRTAGLVVPSSKLQAAPAAASAGSPVSVTVVNQTRSEASVTERYGPGGTREIEILIADTVAADVARGGPVSRAIGNRFGTRPRGV